MTSRSVYVTTATRAEAVTIGRALVEARLVACANVLDNVTSIYWWEGQVESDSEVALIAKTRAELVDAVVDKIKALHSYDVPCVVAWDVVGGNPDYLSWIENETSSAS